MSGPESAEIAGCEHERGCITCGDTAVRMRVVSVDQPREVARCVEAQDLEGLGPPRAPRGELVDLGILEGVGVGDVVLVHAGTALHLEGTA